MQNYVIHSFPQRRASSGRFISKCLSGPRRTGKLNIQDNTHTHTHTHTHTDRSNISREQTQLISRSQTMECVKPWWCTNTYTTDGYMAVCVCVYAAAACRGEHMQVCWGEMCDTYRKNPQNMRIKSPFFPSLLTTQEWKTQCGLLLFGGFTGWRVRIHFQRVQISLPTTPDEDKSAC